MTVILTAGEWKKQNICGASEERWENAWKQYLLAILLSPECRGKTLSHAIYSEIFQQVLYGF